MLRRWGAVPAHSLRPQQRTEQQLIFSAPPDANSTSGGCTRTRWLQKRVQNSSHASIPTVRAGWTGKPTDGTVFYGER